MEIKEKITTSMNYTQITELNMKLKSKHIHLET